MVWKDGNKFYSVVQKFYSVILLCSTKKLYSVVQSSTKFDAQRGLNGSAACSERVGKNQNIKKWRRQCTRTYTQTWTHTHVSVSVFVSVCQMSNKDSRTAYSIQWLILRLIVQSRNPWYHLPPSHCSALNHCTPTQKIVSSHWVWH